MEQDGLALERAIFAASGAPSLLAVTVRPGETSIRGHGRAAPDARSLFAIGSISKLLACDLLLALAAEGRLTLDDPLSRFPPPGWRGPPSEATRRIALESLATHTSGLPRAAGTGGDRWAWLQRQTALPAMRAVYSNLAFDVLGDALSRAAGEPYDRALRRRITGPLGMADTTAAPNRAQCARLLGGGACPDRSDGAASGGLYSTGADMAAYLGWRLGLKGPPDPLRAARNAIRVSGRRLERSEGLDLAGPPAGLALGWVQLAAQADRPAILQKTGGLGGFMSYMAIVPERRAGVFVVANRLDVPALGRMAAQTNDLLAALSRR